jgi:hypothetical protein
MQQIGVRLAPSEASADEDKRGELSNQEVYWFFLVDMRIPVLAALPSGMWKSHPMRWGSRGGSAGCPAILLN